MRGRTRSFRAMNQRIVVALDPDAVAPEAIELGHTMACAIGARLTLLAVTHDGEGADEQLARGREQLLERGNDDVYAHAIVARSAESGLHHAAGRDDTGLVVLGPSERGTAAHVLALTTAARFLHGAPCPVAIAPAGYRDPERALERIGVAFADTPDGHEALRAAAALARWTGARLRLIAVAELGVLRESVAATGEIAEELLEHHRALLRAALVEPIEEICTGVECETLVLDGDPVQRLAGASGDVDLLVCGSRDHGLPGAVLLGSVSRPLLERVACPLLIVPRGREHRLGDMVSPRSAATR